MYTHVLLYYNNYYVHARPIIIIIMYTHVLLL